MDRMSALDSGFFFAESENTPMHVGSVTVFEGPAPTYGDMVRLLLSKLPLVPRYRQRVKPVPMQLGRPVWVDDPHRPPEPERDEAPLPPVARDHVELGRDHRLELVERRRGPLEDAHATDVHGIGRTLDVQERRVHGAHPLHGATSLRDRCGKLRPVRDVALFFHLLGALVFVAGIVVAGVAFEAARRRERPAEIALLLGLTRIGVALVGLGALLVLAFGLWLVHLDRYGLGTGWIVAALALYVVALALGGLGGRRPKQARKLAGALAADDAPATPEVRALLDDRVSLVANYASALAVLAILVLMVFKP